MEKLFLISLGFLVFMIIIFSYSYVMAEENSGPVKQLRSGVAPFEVKCYGGLQLVFRPSNDYPACVKPQTAKQLVERGWKMNEIQKIWVEMKIGCQCDACYMDWLKPYYKTPYPRCGSGLASGASFEKTEEFIKDYFSKQQIKIFDVKYDFVEIGGCEGGECADTYKLLIQVADSQVQQMLDIGFHISGNQTTANNPIHLSIRQTESILQGQKFVSVSDQILSSLPTILNGIEEADKLFIPATVMRCDFPPCEDRLIPPPEMTYTTNISSVEAKLALSSLDFEDILRPGDTIATLHSVFVEYGGKYYSIIIGGI